MEIALPQKAGQPMVVKVSWIDVGRFTTPCKPFNIFEMTLIKVIYRDVKHCGNIINITVFFESF